MDGEADPHRGHSSGLSHFHRDLWSWTPFRLVPVLSQGKAFGPHIGQSLGVGTRLRSITLGEVLAGCQGNCGRSTQQCSQQLREGGLGPGAGCGWTPTTSALRGDGVVSSPEKPWLP